MSDFLDGMDERTEDEQGHEERYAERRDQAVGVGPEDRLGQDLGQQDHDGCEQRKAEQFAPLDRPERRTVHKSRPALNHQLEEKRRRDVGEIVADQYHDKESLAVAEQADQLAGGGVALLVQAAQAEAVNRNHRDLRAGEEGAHPQTDQDGGADEDQFHDCTSSAPGSESPSPAAGSRTTSRACTRRPAISNTRSLSGPC